MNIFILRSLILFSAAVLAACGGARDEQGDTSGGVGGSSRSSVSSSSGSTSSGSTGGGGWSIEGDGTDCPAPVASTLPTNAPRILMIGPGPVPAANGMAPPPDGAPPNQPALQWPNTNAIAESLRGMLAADPSFASSEVVVTSTDIIGGRSLMNFFYQPDGRDARIAALEGPWSYVVMLEDPNDALWYPEFYFEGARVLACHARAAGATPIVLMDWSTDGDASARGDITYRVANGTGSVVAPAGFAWQDAAPSSPALGSEDSYIAAATLYTTLTGKNAADTGYIPIGFDADRADDFALVAHDAVLGEATKTHYDTLRTGSIQTREMPAGGDFWFMDSGTSSEQIWFDRMNEILPKAGFVAQGTQIGVTNATKTFDEADLANAAPYFAAEQYRVLLTRGYDIDAATIMSQGPQSGLQVEVWDRQADSDPSDGEAAVGMMENMSFAKYAQASARGLTLLPYHLMFSKLKTMRPSVALLSDGTHATYPVGYGLATMSLVSSTGIHAPTDGLDADTELAAVLAEETIRQLSALSVSGAFVTDDPATRPKIVW